MLAREIDRLNARIETLQWDVNYLEEQMPLPILNSKFSPFRVASIILDPFTLGIFATTSEITEIRSSEEGRYERYDRLNSSRKQVIDELDDLTDLWYQKMEDLETLAESYDLPDDYHCEDSAVTFAYDSNDGDMRCLISFYLDNYNNDDPGNPHRHIHRHLR